MNAAEFYNDFTHKVFTCYFRSFNPRLDAAIKLCKSYVSQRSNILEIGCGVGFVASHLQFKSYTGIDLSTEAINIAKRLIPNGNFIAADLENFSTSEKFDTILLIDVVEHLDDPFDSLKKLAGLLTNDGQLIICWPAPDAIQSDQPIENKISPEQIIANTGLTPVYLKYVDCDYTNQYVHLILKKSFPKSVAKPQNFLIHFLRSWKLKIKYRNFVKRVKLSV